MLCTTSQSHNQENLILVGGGGHCASCIDVIEQHGKWKIAGIVDVQEELNEKVLGYEIIATDNDSPYLVKEYDNCLITLGQIKSPKRRKELFEILKLEILLLVLYLLQLSELCSLA